MNTQAVNSLTRVIFGAMTKRRTAAGIAVAVDAAVLEPLRRRITELETERALVQEYRVPLEGHGWLLVRQSATTHLWAVTTGGLRGRKVLTPDGWKLGVLLEPHETYRWEQTEALTAATREAFVLGGES